jgi:hypothetical protein
LESADPAAWCRQFEQVRNEFAWTPDMDDVWKPYSWDAICQRVYDDLCELTGAYAIRDDRN